MLQASCSYKGCLTLHKTCCVLTPGAKSVLVGPICPQASAPVARALCPPLSLGVGSAGREVSCGIYCSVVVSKCVSYF